MVGQARLRPAPSPWRVAPHGYRLSLAKIRPAAMPIAAPTPIQIRLSMTTAKAAPTAAPTAIATPSAIAFRLMLFLLLVPAVSVVPARCMPRTAAPAMRRASGSGIIRRYARLRGMALFA